MSRHPFRDPHPEHRIDLEITRANHVRCADFTGVLRSETGHQMLRSLKYDCTAKMPKTD